MRDQNASTEMPPNERLLALANILAHGVLRLYQNGLLSLAPNGLSPETALEAIGQDLELSAETLLSVHKG